MATNTASIVLYEMYQFKKGVILPVSLPTNRWVLTGSYFHPLLRDGCSSLTKASALLRLQVSFRQVPQRLVPCCWAEPCSTAAAAHTCPATISSSLLLKMIGSKKARTCYHQRIWGFVVPILLSVGAKNVALMTHKDLPGFRGERWRVQMQI